MNALTRIASSVRQNELPTWRKVLVVLGATSAGVAPHTIAHGELPTFVWILSIMTVLSGFMGLVPKTLPQIVSRAIWWQIVVLGGLIAGTAIYFNATASDVANAPSEVLRFMAMVFGGAGTALLASGRASLTAEHGKFAPVAFRFSLITSLIMALADTQALLLYSFLHGMDQSMTMYGLTTWLAKGGPLAAAAMVMGVAVYGVYNMRMWGVALNIVANLAIAGLALGGAFALPEALAYGFAATAFLQLLVPIPMLRTIVKNARRA